MMKNTKKHFYSPVITKSFLYLVCIKSFDFVIIETSANKNRIDFSSIFLFLKNSFLTITDLLFEFYL